MYGNTKDPQNSKNNFEKEEWSWKYHTPWFQTILQSYYNLNSIILAQSQTRRSMEINPHVQEQLASNKGGKNIEWGKDSLFNKWCWENREVTCKTIKLNYSLTSCTKNNSKWIKDLNVTIKLLEENIGSMLSDNGLNSIFLDMSPQPRETKTKINQVGLHQTGKICTARETININKMKRPPAEWKKMIANDIANKGLISKMYKELRQLNTKQTNNRFKKWAELLNEHLSKKQTWKDAQHH